ncbi:MAG: F0F1 ATP synthase subunit B [Pseudomonadota bacterium]
MLLNAGLFTATAASAADAADAKAEGVFPPFDPTYMVSQLFWLVITFGILYYVMSKVALPRIGGILEDRARRISQDLDEVARLSEEANVATAAYEQELADARAASTKIANEAKDAAATEAAASRAEAEASLDAKMTESDARIQAIRTKALGEVDQIAEDTTKAIVASLVGGSVTKAEINAALKQTEGN